MTGFQALAEDHRWALQRLRSPTSLVEREAADLQLLPFRVLRLPVVLEAALGGRLLGRLAVVRQAGLGFALARAAGGGPRRLDCSQHGTQLAPHRLSPTSLASSEPKHTHASCRQWAVDHSVAYLALSVRRSTSGTPGAGRKGAGSSARRQHRLWSDVRPHRQHNTMYWRLSSAGCKRLLTSSGGL